MTEIDRLREGYFWPAEARKQHYMVDGRSLCGKWGVIVGRIPLDADPGSIPVCVTCERKVQDRMRIATLKLPNGNLDDGSGV